MSLPLRAPERGRWGSLATAASDQGRALSDARSTRRGVIPWTDSSEALLQAWQGRVAAAKEGHYKLVSQLRRRNVLLGVPAIVFSSVVGTSAFATLSEERVSLPLRIGVGAFSVAAAILAALQTFLRFSERAERHLIAADWYAAMHRDISQLLALPPEARGDPKECFDRIRKEMSKIGQQSPEISERVWTKVARRHGVQDTVVGEPPSPGLSG